MAFKDQFTQFPALTTARLRLRQAVPQDAPAYYDYHNRPEVLRHLGAFTPIESVERAGLILAAISHHFARMDTVHWAITLQGDDKLIGAIQITDFQHRAFGYFGYTLHPSYWGQGIMTEALKAVTRCGIEHFGLNRLQTTILPDNIASRRVVEKAGYTCEGLLREYFVLGENCFSDCYMYSFLRRDLRPLEPGERYELSLETFTDYRERKKKEA